MAEEKAKKVEQRLNNLKLPAKEENSKEEHSSFDKIESIKSIHQDLAAVVKKAQATHDPFSAPER